MTKLPISVCMISGAEAGRIGRTLASVVDWTQEIIVLLNEDVADGTDKIASEYGARVEREPWKGYAAQKNSVCQKASGDWLLGLDADEVVSPALRDEIIRSLTESSRCTDYAAFSFPRLSLYYGRWIRHGEWYPDRKVRLWRRGKGRWEGASLHEQMIIDGKVGKLRHELLHYSMESLDDQIRKTVRYAEDFAQGCGARGRSVGFFDLLVRPAWRFLRSFVFKRGFLDGWQGLSIAWMTTFYTFLRYFKAFEAQQDRHSR